MAVIAHIGVFNEELGEIESMAVSRNFMRGVDSPTWRGSEQSAIESLREEQRELSSIQKVNMKIEVVGE